MMEQLIEVLIPVLVKLIGGVFGVLAAYTIYELRKFIVVKIGEINYMKAIEVARGLYVMLEDKFGAKTGAIKAEEMAMELHKLFPNLTETELIAINKLVWEEFNLKYTATIESLGVAVENLDE